MYLFFATVLLLPVVFCSSSELEKICNLFQAAQVAMNASAAASLFALNGSTNIPVGSKPVVSRVWRIS